MIPSESLIDLHNIKDSFLLPQQTNQDEDPNESFKIIPLTDILEESKPQVDPNEIGSNQNQIQTIPKETVPESTWLHSEAKSSKPLTKIDRAHHESINFSLLVKSILDHANPLYQ